MKIRGNPLVKIVADLVRHILQRKPSIRINIAHINQTCDIVYLFSPSIIRFDWIFFDSLWADPNPGRTKGISKRGDDCFCFGADTTAKFLKENKLHMIVRSHELPAAGRGFQVGVLVFSCSPGGPPCPCIQKLIMLFSFGGPPRGLQL